MCRLGEEEEEVGDHLLELASCEDPIIFDGVEVKLFQFNGQLNSLTCKVEFMQGQGGRVGVRMKKIAPIP